MTLSQSSSEQSSDGTLQVIHIIEGDVQPSVFLLNLLSNFPDLFRTWSGPPGKSGLKFLAAFARSGLI